MNMVQTRAGELGEMVAENIRDQFSKATAGTTLATYIEDSPPVSWAALGDAGWDLVGVPEEDDGATLRDLVEIGIAWGEHLIQLPFITSLMTKRHSPVAADHDGPTTLGVPLRRLKSDQTLIPFGKVDGIGVLHTLDESAEVHPVELVAVDDYAPSLLAGVGSINTQLGQEARREFSVVWAAEAAGRAKAVLDHAVEFVKEREQFGVPVGSFQAVKHHLANAHIEAELAETSTIWASLVPEESDRAVKQAFREAQMSMHHSVQTFGGLGFTWEMGLHFSLRHVATLRELAMGVLHG